MTNSQLVLLLSALKEDPLKGSYFIQSFWKVTAVQRCVKHLCFVGLELSVIPAGLKNVFPSLLSLFSISFSHECSEGGGNENV